VPPVDFTQLGVAAIVCVVLVWVVSLIVRGQLHTQATVEAYRERIAQAEADKLSMASQNSALATALAASSQQVQTALEIATKALAEE